jgi:hypothetical protein
MLPLATVLTLLTPNTVLGTVSIGDASGIVVLLVAALAGIGLRVVSRDPFPRLEWPQPAGWGRWFTRALSLLSYVVVAITLLLGGLMVGRVLRGSAQAGMRQEAVRIYRWRGARRAVMPATTTPRAWG